MRRFLFLDKLWDVSDKVRIEYEAEIQVSVSINYKLIIKKFLDLRLKRYCKRKIKKKKKNRNFTKPFM